MPLRLHHRHRAQSVAVPANTGAPAVTGTAVVGNTLTCSTGTWTNSPSFFSYQWQSSPDTTTWTNIGTNQQTYKLLSSEEGRYVRCAVTATNAVGTTTANSAATALVVAANANQYGIASGAPSYIVTYYGGQFADYMAKMGSVGAQVVRTDFTGYGLNNNFDQSYAQAVANGMSMSALPMIRASTTVATVQAWAQQILANYPLITKVELGNEPNGSGQYSGTVSAADYASKAKAMSDILRAGNPDIVLCAAGLAQYGVPPGTGNVDCLTYLQQMIDQGLAPYVDAFAIHLYGDWAWTTLLTGWRNKLVANGLSAWPTWITEWGNPTNSGTVFTGGVTEAAMATEVTQRFAYFSAQTWIGDTYYYSGIDHNTTTGTSKEDHFGLYKTNGTRKPSADTFQTAMATYGSGTGGGGGGGGGGGAPQAGNFGYTTIGANTDEGVLDAKVAYRAAATATANITKLQGYVSGLGTGSGSQVIKAVVYSDTAGAPDTLLATSNEVTVTDGRTWGWTDFPLSTPLAVVNGSFYWLGYHSGGVSRTVQMRYDPAGSYATNSDTYSGGAATPFGAATTGTRSYSLVGIYAVASSGNLSVSGNEITDTVRDARIQGDGLDGTAVGGGGGGSGGTLTTSGNEITDSVRATATQGDGL